MRARGRRVFQAARGDAGGDRARHLRRADADRARPPRRARARGLRPGAARRPLPAPRPRRADRADQRHRLRPDARRAQSRIDETIAQVVAGAHVGNVYVNRNMVGAVVGVQPFGGEGLSGTGPKAGGPLYLYRLLARPPADAMARALAAGSVDESPPLDGATPLRDAAALGERRRQTRRSRRSASRFEAASRVGVASLLAGPTGERNVYTLQPRDAVLCLGADENDRLVQLAAVLAVGSRALWPSDSAPLRARLPEPVRARIDLVDDWTAAAARFDAVLHHGSADELLAHRRRARGATRADRRRRRIAAGRDRAGARAPRRRARAERQHRGRRRQRDPDDPAMRTTRAARVPRRSSPRRSSSRRAARRPRRSSARCASARASAATRSTCRRDASAHGRCPSSSSSTAAAARPTRCAGRRG